ncbi:MAG: response regulator [Candidatus Thermoplasmatota archaeon]|nr:response regulator [Candidatus Thermoplasmatota archaeon]
MSKVILIVDDEPMIHELLTINFRRMRTPVEVVSTRTGEEAIATYRTLLQQDKRPDLVVMDLNLSGEEAMEAVERHREGGEPLDGVRTTREILKLDPTARIWGYTAWFDTEWSGNLERYADRVVKRTVPFRQFAQMVDRFFQQD